MSDKASIVGSSVSLTVTFTVLVAVRPVLASVPVKVTKVVPTGKLFPAGASLVMVTTSTSFETEGSTKLTTAEQFPGSLLTVISLRAPSAKSGTRVTITSKLNVAVFPLASVAVNSTVVVPTGKVEPLTIPAVCVITTLGQLSLALGVAKVTVAPASTNAFTLISA